MFPEVVAYFDHDLARLKAEGIVDARKLLQRIRAVTADTDLDQLLGGITTPGGNPTARPCGVAGSRFSCVTASSGPFVLTEAQQVGACPSKMALSVVAQGGDAGQPRWAVSGNAQAMALHAARVLVKRGEVFVVGVEASVPEKADARCGVAWAGFRPYPKNSSTTSSSDEWDATPPAPVTVAPPLVQAVPPSEPPRRSEPPRTEATPAPPMVASTPPTAPREVQREAVVTVSEPPTPDSATAAPRWTVALSYAYQNYSQVLPGSSPPVTLRAYTGAGGALSATRRFLQAGPFDFSLVLGGSIGARSDPLLSVTKRDIVLGTSHVQLGAEITPARWLRFGLTAGPAIFFRSWTESPATPNVDWDGIAAAHADVLFGFVGLRVGGELLFGTRAVTIETAGLVFDF